MQEVCFFAWFFFFFCCPNVKTINEEDNSSVFLCYLQEDRSLFRIQKHQLKGGGKRNLLTRVCVQPEFCFCYIRKLDIDVDVVKPRN